MLCFGSAGFAFFIGRQIVCPLADGQNGYAIRGFSFYKGQKTGEFHAGGVLWPCLE